MASRMDRTASHIVNELNQLLAKRKVQGLSPQDHTKLIVLRRALRRRKKEILRESNSRHISSVNRLFKLERTKFRASVARFRQQAGNTKCNVKLNDFS